MDYKNEERVSKRLFREDGHYLGRPADYEDKIISRRVKLVEQIPGFTGPLLDLLEIGCGNGASMFLLADKMRKCVGIEVTDEHRSAFEQYKKERQIENCEYRIVDVVNATPSEQFDRLISFEVIEHLTTENALKYYYDSLKEGGMMAISVPNKWWIFETHGASLPLLPWNRVPFFSWLPRPLHERWANARIYTKKRICRLLEKHGFEVMSTAYITAPMDVLPEGKLKRWVVRNIFNNDTTDVPFKSTSIFVVARKGKLPGM